MRQAARSCRRTFVVATLLLLGACAHGLVDGDLSRTARLVNTTVRANHFRPNDLDEPAYRRIEEALTALGKTAAGPDVFMTEANKLWQNGPFSHVGLRKADEPAAARLARQDGQSGGEGAVKLEWQGRAAVLTVNTMSGADTIQKIEAAYDEIAAKGAERLIIDLRANSGGAFAVVPLVGHLIAEPMDAGVFISHRWYRSHRDPPRPADFKSATPWRGYSVTAFIEDMQSRALTSYRIDPMKPMFRGPVYVLTSGRSVSAAEIAADALKVSGRAKVVGAKTPGVVLSSQRFDMSGGYHLIVPIADYYSISGRRLERAGVEPDVAVPPDQALAAALGL